MWMSAVLQRATLATANARTRREALSASVLMASRAMLQSQMDAKVSLCNSDSLFAPPQ